MGPQGTDVTVSLEPAKPPTVLGAASNKNYTGPHLIVGSSQQYKNPQLY